MGLPDVPSHLESERLEDLNLKGRNQVSSYKKMVLQAATNMGLSDNQVSKLFGVPSTGRILREHRALATKKCATLLDISLLQRLKD